MKSTNTALAMEEDKLNDSEDFYGDESLEEDFEPLVPAKAKANSDSPGFLRTHGKFTVHTKGAHRLFFGRRKSQGVSPITGLVQFSSNINLIYSASENDDPYADRTLLEIEESIENVLKLIDEKDSYLTDLLGQEDNVEIFPSSSVEPQTLEIEFRTPYGYLGLRLLSGYDKLLMKALAAKHAALIFNDDWKNCVNEVATKIRYTFGLSRRYRFTGTSRSDFAANNQKATTAIEKYGSLPPEILEGKQRPKHAPNIKSNSK